MSILFYILMAFSIGLLIVSMYQIVRLHFLSKAVQQAIDDTFEQRMSSGTSWTSAPYPDIRATYNNLKWYKPWERPSTLIVYKD